MRAFSLYTLLLFSALMVFPCASEKAGLGCIPDASKIGGNGACCLNIKSDWQWHSDQKV